MRSSRLAVMTFAALAAGGSIGGISPPAAGQILIIGNDEKQGWDENAKPVLREPGKEEEETILSVNEIQALAQRFRSSIQWSGRRRTWRSIPPERLRWSPIRSNRLSRAGVTGSSRTTKFFSSI